MKAILLDRVNHWTTGLAECDRAELNGQTRKIEQTSEDTGKAKQSRRGNGKEKQSRKGQRKGKTKPKGQRKGKIKLKWLTERQKSRQGNGKTKQCRSGKRKAKHSFSFSGFVRYDDANIGVRTLLQFQDRLSLFRQHLSLWCSIRTRGLQRDAVYLGCSYASPNAGGGGSCGVSANEYSCTQEPK